MPLGVLFVMKTLEDERYVVIKAYKLTVFDILRNIFVLSYIACPRYPYIRVYRLDDSIAMSLGNWFCMSRMGGAGGGVNTAWPCMGWL